MFFFFQAEDGIRDLYVTGVQTCALPIFTVAAQANSASSADPAVGLRAVVALYRLAETLEAQIGRASCRERVEISGVAASVIKKKKRRPGIYGGPRLP